MRSRLKLSLGLALLLAVTTVPWLPAAEDALPPGLLATLKGHKEAVYGIAFTPDGQFVITGSGDPSIKVWNAATGKEIKSFAGPSGHKQFVLGVAVAPDGTQFATAGGDNTLRVWDFPTSKPLAEYAQGAPATSVAASADGTRLAAGTQAGLIKIWSPADGKVAPLTLTGHQGTVNALAFSPNGQTLVSGGADSTVRYWNVADGKPLAASAGHAGPVTGVAFNPGANAVVTTGQDGRAKFWSLPPVADKALPPLDGPVAALALNPEASQAAASSGKAVRLLNLAGGNVTWQGTSPVGNLTALAVSPAGALVAAAADSRHLLVYQTKDGKLLSQTLPHAKGLAGVSFSPTGDRLATAGLDGAVRLWAMPPALLPSFPHPDGVRAAVTLADKRVITGGADKVVRLWDLTNPKTPERQYAGHTGPVNAVAVSQDGQTIASAGDDGSLRFWSRSKGEQVAQIGAHAAPITALSYAGTQALTASLDGAVKLWVVPAPTANKGILAHGGAVTSAALTPDGTRLVTGSADKQVRIWNTATSTAERTLTGPTLAVSCVAVSSAGPARVAAGSADRSVWVWESATGKEVAKLVNLPAAVQAVALSADGKLVAAGLADNTARLYELPSGKETKAFKGHAGPVHSLLFAPKGDQVISAGADAKVRLWGVADGAEKSAIAAGPGALTLALSPDGLRLAVGGADKTVKVVTLADGKQQAGFATPAGVNALAFAADGKRLAVAGSDGTARVVEADGAVQESVTHDGPVHAVAFAPDGRRVYTGSADKTARAWPLSLAWQARPGAAVRAVASTSRGYLAGVEDGTVRTLAVADGKEVGKPLKAHDKAVVALAASPDGGKVVTVSADRTGKVWEPAKAADKPVATFTLPGDPQSVSLSPNTLRIAVGLAAPKEGKERIAVFDAVSGAELTTLGEESDAPSRSLAFQADGRTLLAAGDRAAALLDVNVLAAFEAHPGGASAVAFLPSGTQIVTGGADRTAKLWNLTTGKAERTFGPLDTPVEAVTVSRDGVQVAATAGKLARVWAVADGKAALDLAHPERVTNVSFSNDRTRLTTGCADGRARVWDAATREEIQGFLHGAGATFALANPNNPAQVIAAGAEKAVKLHTVNVGRVFSSGAPLPGLSLSSTGQQVLLGAPDGKVKLVNTSSGAVERTLEGGEKAVTATACSKNGQLIATGGADAKVRLLNFADGKPLAVITAPAAVRSLQFSPTSQAVVAACDDGSLVTYDTLFAPGQPIPAEFGKVVQATVHKASDLAFPGVGATFYTAGADSAVKAWRLASEAPTRTFTFPATVSAAAFDPAGQRLASACADGKVRLHELAKGTQLREINAHATMNLTSAYAVAWSPDGKQVVSASVDQTLKLWDATSGALVKEFRAYKEKEFEKGHQEAVLAVAFSPDGKQIASGGMDRAIKVWNVADGSVVREFVNPDLKPLTAGLPAPAHPGWVYSLRWTKDGKLISAGGAPRLRGYLGVWEANSGKLLFGKELAVGTIFSLAVRDDGKMIALGTGGSVRMGPDLNQGLILEMPGTK